MASGSRLKIRLIITSRTAASFSCSMHIYFSCNKLQVKGGVSKGVRVKEVVGELVHQERAVDVVAGGCAGADVYSQCLKVVHKVFGLRYLISASAMFLNHPGCYEIAGEGRA